MGLKRARSVRVADIVIPDSLIATTRGNGRDWEPFRRDQELGQGPVQTAIRRTASVRPGLGTHSGTGRAAAAAAVERYRRRRRNSLDSMPASRDGNENPGLAPPGPAALRNAWIGRPRKTSDPITYEEAQRASLFSPALALGARNYGLTTQAASALSVSDALAAFQFPGSTTETLAGSVVGDEEEDDEKNQLQLQDGLASSDAEQSDTSSTHTVFPGRRSSIYETYERAKVRGVEMERKPWVRVLFEYSVYVVLLAFIYFVLVGMPLWRGAVYWLYWVFSYKLTPVWGWSITIGIAVLLAFAPLLIVFETAPPPAPPLSPLRDRNDRPGVRDTALLIPCYKSASIIGPTLEAALKIFPPSHIFVIANGNAPAPLDNTEEVCRPYGVNHIWSPVGSKIVAQFVGCHAARTFQNVLLIDDDCALPANFPVVSERLAGRVQCIGYTIKSVGAQSTPGTWCQQAQDLEYKISGLQRALAGKIGSATFPHGAISLWDRSFLIQTFHNHPGFSVSEDWFFGHSCRRLGGRIQMCTSVFVETETPAAVFFAPRSSSRGGFGEMTVFKQRFSRWNFFFVNGMWYNMAYVLGSWRLGWWELGAKIFVLQEVYETLLYLLAPFVLPISFVVQPAFSGYLFAGTLVLYYINILLFNLIHLRMSSEQVSWTVVLFYYMPYKLTLSAINVASCYWSLYKYASYFARRHPKVIEDEKAVEVVLRLDETAPSLSRATSICNPDDRGQMGRRMMAVPAIHSPNGLFPHSRGASSTDSSHTAVTNAPKQPQREPVITRPAPALRRKASWSESMV